MNGTIEESGVPCAYSHPQTLHNVQGDNKRLFSGEYIDSSSYVSDHCGDYFTLVGTEMSSHLTYFKNRHVDVVNSSNHLFSHHEILTGTEKFLERVGYKLVPKSQLGIPQLDIYAQRAEGNKNFEVFGLVCTGLEQAADGYTRLAAIQTSPRKEADYVLVMPPVNEYPIIQFFTADRGKWFYEFKKFRFMMWLCNPKRDAVSCITGSTRDRLLERYFTNGYHPIDQYISALLSKELMKDGDF